MHAFSFVVEEGRVIDAARYAAAARELGVSTAALNRLRVRLSMVAGTRRAKLEIHGGTASLELRPLPPAPAEITVAARPIRDERTLPAYSGPDLGWQRFTLAQTPAHEGLLVDATGRVVSAIMAPLVMLQHGRAYISSHERTSASIALDGVVEILAGQGVELAHLPGGFIRSDLLKSEVWVIDPVYGARLVTTWLEYGTSRPARQWVERGRLPTHREVNELRERRAVAV